MKTLIVATLLVFVLVSCDEDPSPTYKGKWKFTATGIIGEFVIRDDNRFVEDVVVNNVNWVGRRSNTTEINPVGSTITLKNKQTNASDSIIFVNCVYNQVLMQITNDSVISVLNASKKVYKGIVLTKN